MSTDSSIPPGAPHRAQPESFRARSLEVSLTVKDVAKSLAWYCDVMAFTLDEEYEREGKLVAASLKAGSVRILIGQDDGKKGWDRVKGEGFSMQFTTVQNVDDIARRVVEHGGTLDSGPRDMPWGARMFRVKDPDGFRLTITSERTAAKA